MTEGDRTLIDEWIEKHGYDRCPQCNVEGGLVVSQKMPGPSQLPEPGQEPTAFINLTCKNCALVRLLSPRVIGLTSG